MGKYGMTSNYMIINYLNCLQKAATPLTVSSGRQRQAAANSDVSPDRPSFCIGVALGMHWFHAG